MEKVLDFLETYVEWLALALGALFFGFMIWTYLVSSPATKTYDGQVVAPGNVDDVVAVDADRLNNIMKTAQVPSFRVEPFKNAVEQGIDLTNAGATQVAAADFNYQPLKLSEVINEGLPKESIVKALPVLPKASPLFVEAGKTTILNPPQAAGMAQPAGAGQPAHMDIDWATVAFQIPTADLAAQWNSAFGPEKPGGPTKLTAREQDTEFLQIVAYRSEQLADGSWGDEVEVPHLTVQPLQPYPAPDASIDTKTAYEGWARRAILDIASPAFPATASDPAGTIWESPTAVLENKLNPGSAPQNQPMMPGMPQYPTYPGGFRGGYRPFPPGAYPGQGGFPRPQANDYHGDGSGFTIDLAGPGGGGGRGGGGGGGYGGRGLPGVFRGPPTGFRPPTPQPQEQQQPTQPVIPPDSVDPIINWVDGLQLAAPLPTVMNNPFNPANIQGSQNAPQANNGTTPNILVWVTDDSVKSGKTYRYRISYKLYNPVYNFAADRVTKEHQIWLQQFSLDAPVSEYAPAVTVPARTFFFCAANNGTTVDDHPEFPFEVFTWADGKWQKHTFTVAPGDAVGGEVGDANFGTGYTFVDGHHTQEGRYVVTLVDQDGDAVVRDAERDATDKDRSVKQAWVAQENPAPPQPVTTGAPGSTTPGATPGTPPQTIVPAPVGGP